MVSRKRLVLAAAACGFAIFAFAESPAHEPAPAKKFFSDDPLWRDPAPRTVQNVATRKIDDIYDFLENSYITPRREGKMAKESPRRALDINTLGEVPDGPWYTNRHASRR